MLSEYLLLGILVSFAFIQYTGDKQENEVQKIQQCSWTHNLCSCNKWPGFMLIINGRASTAFLQIIGIH